MCNVCDSRVQAGESCITYAGASDDGLFRVYYHPMCWSFTANWDYWDWEHHAPGLSRREIAMHLIAGDY